MPISRRSLKAASTGKTDYARKVALRGKRTLAKSSKSLIKRSVASTDTHLAALRIEVAKFVGALLKDHAEQIWADEDWRSTPLMRAASFCSLCTSLRAARRRRCRKGTELRALNRLHWASSVFSLMVSLNLIWHHSA